MKFYNKLFKTTVGKLLLFLMITLSVMLGVVFAVNIESETIAFLWWFFATVAVVIFFLIAMVIILVVTDYRNLEISQEIKERVKVLSKRQLCIGTDDSNDSFIDFITFEFSDGTSEEMSIGTSKEIGIIGNRIRSKSIFYITTINDTGLLTYKILHHRPRQILTVHQEDESRKKFIKFNKD